MRRSPALPTTPIGIVRSFIGASHRRHAAPQSTMVVQAGLEPATRRECVATIRLDYPQPLDMLAFHVVKLFAALPFELLDQISHLIGIPVTASSAAFSPPGRASILLTFPPKRACGFARGKPAIISTLERSSARLCHGALPTLTLQEHPQSKQLLLHSTTLRRSLFPAVLVPIWTVHVVDCFNRSPFLSGHRCHSRGGGFFGLKLVEPVSYLVFIVENRIKNNHCTSPYCRRSHVRAVTVVRAWRLDHLRSLIAGGELPWCLLHASSGLNVVPTPRFAVGSLSLVLAGCALCLSTVSCFLWRHKEYTTILEMCQYYI